MLEALFAVLLWDAWFWDDTLMPGEGVGTVLVRDGITEQVVAWTPEGYALRELRRVPITSARPHFDAPIVRRFGRVELEVRAEGDRLVGRVLPAAVDPAALPSNPLDPGGAPIEGAPAAAPTDEIEVDTLAPFPVRVDAKTSMLVPTEIDLTGHWPIVAGMDVWAEGEPGLVLLAEDQVLTVRAHGGRVVDLLLDNPDDVEVPVVVPVGAAALLAAAGLAVARRRRSRGPLGS